MTDNGNARVQVFTSTGRYLTTWGTFGSGLGQFNGNAGGISVDNKGHVYVADVNDGRLEKFMLHD